MATTKVYLSKSKAGDLTYIDSVRKVLQALDVELLEFSGGTYNTDALLKADILIVVPPGPKIDIQGSKKYWIGKGQYTEIETFDTVNSSKPILIVYETDYNLALNKPTFSVEDLCDAIIIDQDWKQHYATVETNDWPSFITDYDDITYKKEENSLHSIMESYDFLQMDSESLNQAVNEAQRAIIAKAYEKPVKRKIRLACITLFK